MLLSYKPLHLEAQQHLQEEGCIVDITVSADGDGKRSSGVDDLDRNEPPSQVLALTSRCHMWLHVLYGV